MKKLWLIVPIILIGLFAIQFDYEEPVFRGDLNESVTIVRDGYDLPPLTINKELNDIAILKCNDMVYRDYFSHVTPEGKFVWEQYNFGEYNTAGENLAHGYWNAFDTVQAWRESPKHLDNLKNAAYKEVGYAVCKNNTNGYYVVQIFRG